MLGSGEVLKLNNLPRERGGEEGEVVKRERFSVA